MLRFVRELRRRHVLRSAGYYLVGSWLLLQVGDVIADPAGLPSWSMAALLYAAIACFPLALYLGWRYDIQDGRLIRTRAASVGEIDSIDIGLKFSDYAIFASLLALTASALYQVIPALTEVDTEIVLTPVASSLAPGNSIAVLPFSDISQGGDQEYLGDGISDTVLHVLSRIDGIIVTSRTSSFSFKEQSLTLTEIAERLHVAHILEGSVQKAGEEVRIIARLAEAVGGTEVWSGYYDRQLADIFDIQDEIAREVVAAMQVTLIEPSTTIVKDRYRPDLVAYEQFILGRAAVEQRSMAGILAGREYFEKAIELDPNYPEPYIHLANTWMQSFLNQGKSMQELVAFRRPLVEKALDLDPTSAPAETAFGFLLRDEGNMQGSSAAFDRAMDLNPNFALAYAGAGSNLFRTGEFETSLEFHRKAVELDPEENQYHIFLANAYWNVAQAERAIGLIRDRIQVQPDNPANYGMMVRMLSQTGKAGEAMRYRRAASIMDRANPGSALAVCTELYELTATEQAVKCLENFLAEYPDNQEASFFLNLYVEQPNKALEIGRQMWAKSANSGSMTELLVTVLEDVGEWDEALELIQEAQPGLFAEQPIVTPWNIWMSTMAVTALSRTGQIDSAEKLAKAGIDSLSRQRAMQGAAHVIGTEPAQYYASLGQREAMLEALKEAIDAGWSTFAVSTLRQPSFDPFREDTGFIELQDQLFTRLRGELAWYEEHKDDPL